MRDYGKVAPQFWTGSTGKDLKAAGPEAVIVGLYLMTSPHANMIGVYYLPVLYIAHETGLGLEGASKGLQRAIEAGFCTYDEASEYVFVHAMARYQIAPSLSPGDKRCKGVANELERCPNHVMRKAFFALYSEAFHLPEEVAEPSPLEAPSKPLGSQEQEQEQEQKEDIAQQAARLPARFDEFWSEYPNKRGKAVAAKAWRRKRLDKIADRIIEDVKARKASDPRWQEGFIPDGSTYVNQERWEDAIDAPRLRAVAGSDYVPLPGEV